MAATLGLNSCTAAIFCLPEPKTKAEKLRNDLSPLAIPVAVAADVAVVVPALLVTGVARAAVCGVSEPQADKRTDDGSGSMK